jgi:hexosaminidase
MTERGARLAALALAILAIGWRAGAEPIHLDIIPKPSGATAGAGAPIWLRPGARIGVAPGDAAALADARWLADLAKRSRGLALTPAVGGGTILFKRLPGATTSEAYRLEIGRGRVVISAASDRGLVWGVASLWQLMTARPGRGAAGLDPLVIDDAPRFAWRGLMLDSARHMQSPAFILNTLDWMALHKLNVLHWHLTDDQGWRIPIEGYPRLTTVGAWRTPAGFGRQAPYGGFYTRAEIRQIVARAGARGINIVPEIEMPGHALSALLAYPALSASALPPKTMQSDWGQIPAAYGVDEPVFVFLDRVLNQVMDLFPGRFVHIGGDEVPLDLWKASPAVQARMKALGVANEAALQNWFIRRIDRTLEARGRRLIGWEEIFQGGPLPPSAAITSWQGASSAVAAARAGHDVVLAIAPTLYFDNRQASGVSEPPGRGMVVRLRDVYALDPAAPPLTAGAPAFTDADRTHLLGVQGNLFTEHVRTDERAAKMIWPRAAAVAEAGWTPQAQRAWPDFQARLPSEFSRFATLGLDEDPSALSPEPAAPQANVRASQQLAVCPDGLPLNLEGQPTAGGRRPVVLVNIMNPCTTWPDVNLAGVTSVKLTLAAMPFNFQLGPDTAHVVHRPSNAPGGEIEVRLDDCDKGERLLARPLPAPQAEIRLEAPLPARTGVHRLCFVYANGEKLDPLWTVERVELIRAGVHD